MSCILTIQGKNFNVHAFVEKSKLKPYIIKYKGQPRLKTKPEGEKLSHSLLSIEASNADFDNLKKQIADTVRFLKRNKNKLTFIDTTKGIDYAGLDFGIDLRIDRKKILYQSDTFPNNLLKLAGDLKLDITLSIYPIDMQQILEKAHAKKKTSPNKSIAASGADTAQHQQ